MHYQRVGVYPKPYPVWSSNSEAIAAPARMHDTVLLLAPHDQNNTQTPLPYYENPVLRDRLHASSNSLALLAASRLFLAATSAWLCS
jgi:hypothetical protein